MALTYPLHTFVLQIIREDDIKETQLWHECQGKPPSKCVNSILHFLRLVDVVFQLFLVNKLNVYLFWTIFRYTNIQQGLKKLSIGGNLAVQRSEHRRPRSGLGAGRGVRTHSLNYEPPIPKSSRRENFGLNTTHNSNSQIFPGISYVQRYVRKDAGSGWGEGRGRPNGNHNSSNPSYAASSFRRTSDMNMKEWRVVHSSLDGRNISVESRPSESNRTSEVFQAGSGSFLPSRNNACRPSFSPDDGYGRGTSIGRGQQHHDFSENNQSFARNRSRQSYGRGCNIPYGGYYLS